MADDHITKNHYLQENIGTQARIMSVVSLAVKAAAQEFADIKRAKLKVEFQRFMFSRTASLKNWP